MLMNTLAKTGFVLKKEAADHDGAQKHQPGSAQQQNNGLIRANNRLAALFLAFIFVASWWLIVKPMQPMAPMPAMHIEKTADVPAPVTRFGLSVEQMQGLKQRVSVLNSELLQANQQAALRLFLIF